MCDSWGHAWWGACIVGGGVAGGVAEGVHGGVHVCHACPPADTMIYSQ